MRKGLYIYTYIYITSFRSLDHDSLPALNMDPSYIHIGHGGSVLTRPTDTNQFRAQVACTETGLAILKV